MKESTKNQLLNLVRWGVAGVVLLWLYKSGKLSGLNELSKLFNAPFYFSLACLGLATNYILNFFRWQVLLTGIGVQIPFSQIVRLSMIGQFFSIVMPGSVGGDLIKAVYVARSYPTQRTSVVASILLDRVLGFLTLMGFASFFFVLSFDTSHLSPALQNFGSLLAAGTLTLFLVVLLPARALKFLNRLNSKSAFLEKIAKTLKAFARSPSTILKGLGISFLSQGGAILGMYCIGSAVYGTLPWGNMDFMRFVSSTAVGTTASALPLSPMGLGIGQVAFGKTFLLLGAPSEAYGIVIISAVQIITFVLNLSGAIWFLKSKKEIQQAMS